MLLSKTVFESAEEVDEEDVGGSDLYMLSSSSLASGSIAPSCKRASTYVAALYAKEE